MQYGSNLPFYYALDLFKILLSSDQLRKKMRKMRSTLYPCAFLNEKRFLTNHEPNSSICLRSFYPNHIITYYKNWVKTSWTDSENFFSDLDGTLSLLLQFVQPPHTRGNILEEWSKFFQKKSPNIVCQAGTNTVIYFLMQLRYIQVTPKILQGCVSGSRIINFIEKKSERQIIFFKYISKNVEKNQF